MPDRAPYVDGGLGFGVSKNQLIFVFTSEQALSNFINTNREFGGQANLSAMEDGEGGIFTGAAQISPGVYLYRITETGLSATLTVAGTKFFIDSDLKLVLESFAARCHRNVTAGTAPT